jgi:hypothetical protein
LLGVDIFTGSPRLDIHVGKKIKLHQRIVVKCAARREETNREYYHNGRDACEIDYIS